MTLIESYDSKTELKDYQIRFSFNIPKYYNKKEKKTPGHIVSYSPKNDCSHNLLLHLKVFEED